MGDEGGLMPTYRITYGDDEQVVREVYDNVEIEREDGWLVVFRDRDAILRVQDAHVKSVEEIESSSS
jgi:hypothetical protein